MDAPEVSVIIGTYNKERYIGETVRSVLAQTFENFECLMLDDRSTDGTVAAIEKFDDPRIKLTVRDYNSGRPAIPRNEAMALAQGRYLAFLDADDRWHPTKLERQMAFMDAHQDIPFSHTRCEVIDGAGAVQRIRHAGSIPPTGQVFVPLLQHCYVTTSTVMLRRTFFNSFGGMLEGPEWRTGEDYEYYLRVAAAAPIGFIDEVLASYRAQEQGESISQESSNWRGIPEHIPTLLYILNQPDTWRAVAKKGDIADAVASAGLANSWFWSERGERAKARWFLRKALAIKPFSHLLWKRLLATCLRAPTPNQK